MKSTILLTCVCALLAVVFKSELKAATIATAMQISMFANNYFFFSLFFKGFTKLNAYIPELDMGEGNILTMKLIYVARYIFKDQFLLSTIADKTLADIEHRLRIEYADNGWNTSTFSEIQVPTMQWGEISPEDVHNKFIIPGIPFVLKNVPSTAKDMWSPDFFATHYGDQGVDVVNIDNMSTIRMNMSRYVDAHRTDQDPERGNDTWYIRALSEIFDHHPELVEQLGAQRLKEYVQSKLITSQIFMGMADTSGTSYHSANFNNIFFMINGRKKWTFVSPQYTALMYPMFNAKSIDVASFLTTVALDTEEAMQSHFPLYKYAPKMTVVLEPGDILINPPWQWHMIENLDPVSIGVATRWFLPPKQQIQNSVHNTLQFLSPFIWTLRYSKLLNLDKGMQVHKPIATPPIDERFNFGVKGSAAAYRPKIFPSRVYENIG